MRAPQRWTTVALAALVSTSFVACSGNNAATPTAPTAATGGVSGGSGSSGPTATTNPDGTTLKAGAPGSLSPAGDARVDSRTPTLTWTNAAGRFQPASFTYELEFYKVNDLAFRVSVPQGSGNTTSYTVPSELDYNTIYRWRVRATFGTAFGPWAATANFVTPLPPAPAPGGGGGGGGTPFGPQRTISFNEAFDMIRTYHNISGVDLGSRSSRESRVAWLFEAVAILHYGHARYNPAGGDRDWCVKDAGGGRPPSDDVIVRCSSRDAWDLISGAGANGYSFDWHYVGRLGSEQNVYPPPLGSLPR